MGITLAIPYFLSTIFPYCKAPHYWLKNLHFPFANSGALAVLCMRRSCRVDLSLGGVCQFSEDSQEKLPAALLAMLSLNGELWETSNSHWKPFLRDLLHQLASRSWGFCSDTNGVKLGISLIILQTLEHTLQIIRTPQCDSAFETLKRKLSSALPDPVIRSEWRVRLFLQYYQLDLSQYINTEWYCNTT